MWGPGGVSAGRRDLELEAGEAVPGAPRAAAPMGRADPASSAASRAAPHSQRRAPLGSGIWVSGGYRVPGWASGEPRPGGRGAVPPPAAS